MRALDELKEEHRVIEVMLDALDKLAHEVEKGQPFPKEKAEQTLEMLRVFADRCHHGKEERHLFARLSERGYPRDAGPLGVMLHEHGEGRRHIQAMAHALAADPLADHEFVEHARAYTKLLRAHIQREDHVLFPTVTPLFTPEDDAQLLAAFAEVEREEIGEGVHERYHQWVYELRDAA